MEFKFWCGGIGSTHLPKTIYEKTTGDNTNYVIMQHQTDFSYFKDGEMIDGFAGQILIIPPYTVYKHGPRADAKSGFVDDWMYFESDTAKDILDELDVPLGVAFDVIDNHLIRQYISRLVIDKTICDIGYMQQAISLFYEMLVKIARQKNYSSNGYNNQRIELDKIRQEMLSDYGSTHTLDELAAKVGYSSGHFAALYRKYYGISPIDDLISYRIQIAKFELKRRENSVTEISKKCGFASIHHFSRFFKKYVGVSPSVYRNMQ
ncbi:MAG: helix-turn-helix transcriptional regulator [Clostridia bacterium]|nr:helix-turn-helix transcriptional regulator [Clostridia bacterium]